MSFESDSYFRPAPGLLSSLREFLGLLGYRRVPSSPITWRPHPVATMALGSNKDYQSFSGVYLVICRTRRRGIHIYTRTNSWCSRWDLDQQIGTVRLLKKYFGGTFKTDAGKNRYWRNEKFTMRPAEAGCFLAFQRFEGNIDRAIHYVNERQFAPAYSDPKRMKLADTMNPRLLSNNLLFPYLVSAVEDYFKSAFVALAKSSNAKEKLFRNARVQADKLVTVAAGEASIEEVVADAMSFQNITAICKHFSGLDRHIDFAGALKRPKGRRRSVLFDALVGVVARRHDLIHRNALDLSFEDIDAARAIDDVYAGVRRCHEHLVSVYGWNADALCAPPWTARKRLRLKNEAPSKVTRNDPGEPRVKPVQGLGGSSNGPETGASAFSVLNARTPAASS